jgi:hypothetical protein
LFTVGWKYRWWRYFLGPVCFLQQKLFTRISMQPTGGFPGNAQNLSLQQQQLLQQQMYQVWCSVLSDDCLSVLAQSPASALL